MSTVNSITKSGLYSSDSQQSQISDSTKRTLEALGIDPETVTSESQAQSLINLKQSEQKFQDSLITSSQTNSKGSSNTTETNLISEAKTLAEELGISVSSDATFDEITSEISNAIQKLMDKSANDPQALQRAQTYFTRLNQLTTQYSDVSASNSGIYSAMSAQAATNKYMLGL